MSGACDQGTQPRRFYRYLQMKRANQLIKYVVGEMQEIVTTFESELFYVLGQMKGGLWRYTTSRLAGVQS